MIRKSIILFIALTALTGAYGQSLQQYLQQVSDNNPEIVACRKLLEAKRYEARTGNTPPDPFISAGIMPGAPEAAGNKKIWSVTQSFAFPTKYLQQKKLNNSTILLAEQEFNQGRLQILLEAKNSYLDLGYKTRYLNNLLARKEGYDRLQSGWKKMLDNGQTTIMDYNRIMIEISAVNLEITRTRAEINMLGERLAYIAGDASLKIIPGDFTIITDPDQESLMKEKSQVHPSYLIPELEYEIGVGELKVSRAGALPEFEVGYQSEIVPGETYTGPVAGLSVPLWSNSNRIKAASARADHLSALRDATVGKLNSSVRNEFLNMKALQQSLAELRSIMETGGGTKYLDAALQAGEIPIMTYFTYMEAVYLTEDRLLELENEYQKSLARLLDHELLK
ncbi:MAG TPA: TolC family protein [Bacteroidales bacterium]|nr:TolC family protein [Bacteroidales bacterium]